MQRYNNSTPPRVGYSRICQRASPAQSRACAGPTAARIMRQDRTAEGGQRRGVRRACRREAAACRLPAPSLSKKSPPPQSPKRRRSKPSAPDLECTPHTVSQTDGLYDLTLTPLSRRTRLITVYSALSLVLAPLVSPPSRGVGSAQSQQGLAHAALYGSERRHVVDAGALASLAGES